MLLKVGLLALLLGCPGPAPLPPVRCDAQAVAGDLAQPMKLQAIAVDAHGSLVEVPDGGSLFLQRPPQGGYVIYAGVAALNLTACGAQVSAELIDPQSGNALTGLDTRSGNFTSLQGGFYWPTQGVSELPNIPSCPDHLHVGVVNHAAVLHVEVTDANGKKGKLDLNVTPACQAGDGACPCICGPNPTGC